MGCDDGHDWRLGQLLVNGVTATTCARPGCEVVRVSSAVHTRQYVVDFVGRCAAYLAERGIDVTVKTSSAGAPSG